VAGTGTSTWLFLKEREARQRAVEAERQQDHLRREAEVREKLTRARAFINDEKFDDAEKLVGEITFANPNVEGAAVQRSLGEWHALQNRWKPAADHLKTLLQIDQLDGGDVCTLDYLECGPALIEAGDLNAYERFRHMAIAHGGGAAYPFADRIIKVSLLLPAKEDVIRSLAPMADTAAKSFTANAGANGDVFLAAWRSVSLALFEYRRGNYVKAAEWSRRCLAYSEYNAPRSATARVILAMSCWQTHQPNEARSELAQARESIETKFKGGLDRGTGVQGFWFDWVFGRILLREATSLIENSPERPTPRQNL
jgi:hypothetical protein